MEIGPDPFVLPTLVSGHFFWYLVYKMKNKIKKLFQEDIADRKKPNLDDCWPEVSMRDKERAREVRALIKNYKGKLDVQTLYYMGFIFHHQGTKVSSAKARLLAGQGIELCKGKNTKICKQVRWLYAGSTDRFLRLKGEPQKYGTQYHRKKKGGEYELYRIDPKTTDEERKKFNVPSLKEAKKLAKKII